MALRPEAFQKCFQEWVADAIQPDQSNPDRLIAIDGKTNRRSHDVSQRPSPAPHRQRLGQRGRDRTGQVATEEKSNEITAIPQLLEQIDLTDALVTIDAMGCQKDIARDIVEGGGDFVISVKDNQPTLRETVETYFEKHLEHDLADLRYRSYETSEAVARPYRLAFVND